MFVVVARPRSGLIRIKAFVLPQRDAALDPASHLAIGGAHQLRHDCGGIVGVENRKRFFQAERSTVFAQHLHPQRVEGRDQRALGVAQLHHLLEALGHFLGGLVGEGDRGDRLGRDTALDQMNDLAGDHPGFSAAGPGDHQARPVQIADRLELGCVQGVAHRVTVIRGVGIRFRAGRPPAASAPPSAEHAGHRSRGRAPHAGPGARPTRSASGHGPGRAAGPAASAPGRTR